MLGRLSARDSMKGTLREGSFTGDPIRYVKYGLEMGDCFHRGPTFGEHGRCFFLRAFLFRGIFMRLLQDRQNTLYMGISLHRGPAGEPGGGLFARIFDRKEKYIWVPFLDPEDMNILSLEVIWNYSKGTGLS